MATQKPKKMTVDEYIKSTTLFYIDDELESRYSQSVTEGVDKLRTQLLGVAIPDGLKKYIRDNKDSLHLITSLLNISEERFKRVVTMLRLQRRHKPTSEWTLNTIREQMLADAGVMDEICELLTVGASLEKYKALIPAYYLENFKIDASTLGRLSNEDDARRLIKRGFEGKYSNNIGASYFKLLLDCITTACESTGLTLAAKNAVPIIGRKVSIAIPNVESPRILIDTTYGITTSSTQSDYAGNAEKAASELRKKNDGKPDKQRIVFINVIDGAGWVARRSDLDKIHQCSDYLLNLKTIGTISEIITYYL